MKGNCTRISRWNGATWDLVANRTSITGPALSRETVEQDLTLDCTGNGSAVKQKSPGTKEYGDITVETIWNPIEQTGTAQSTVATAAGSVTASGNASITVTSTGMTGSPLTIPIAVGVGAPSVWAATVRTALANNATIAGRFAVSGTGTQIILTVLPVAGQVPANDGSLNLAIATGTATGITAAPTSAVGTIGVAGFVNKDNHNLFLSDFDSEVATYWMIEHSNTAATGVICHCTVKECGDPEYKPNATVNRTFTLEPTGAFIARGNGISTTTLPSSITAPQSYWGKD